MNSKILCTIAAVAAALLITATNGYSFGSFGNSVNTTCSPVTPYSGDCALCHLSDRSAPTEAKTAFLAGGTTLTDFFCPATPSCTDGDGDTFAIEGGDCGPVDCNDADAAVNPDAAENCSDGIDNNCNDLIDERDPTAIGCPVCTDSDGDTFAVEGGACGEIDCDDTNPGVYPGALDIPNNGIDEDCSGADSVDPGAQDNDGDGYTRAQGDCDDADPTINPGAVDIPNNGIDENCDGNDTVDPSMLDNDGDGYTPAAGDCDDTDAAINPDAIELCTDGIDNDCNGLVDIQDALAVDCPLSCTDIDGDTYSTDGGACGPLDCNDNDARINPGLPEVCGDGADNDCDNAVDEGCDVACPDIDGDGYKYASCGGTDCNDNDAAINPGAAEIPGNGVDENCNGDSDDIIETCPDGSLLTIREMEYEREDRELHIKGRATAGSTLSIINFDTGEVLGEEIHEREGKWKAEIRNVGRELRSIQVVSSSGCMVVYDVSTDDDDNREQHDRDDDHRKYRGGDDHEYREKGGERDERH